MKKEKLDKIARRYAQDELKDNHASVEDIVAAAFLNGIDYAEHHPHWISVEDELPKMETEVLMVSSGCTDTLFGYRCKAGKNGWYCYNDDDYWHNITHWQHLPQPPKEGGEQ